MTLQNTTFSEETVWALTGMAKINPPSVLKTNNRRKTTQRENLGSSYKRADWIMSYLTLFLSAFPSCVVAWESRGQADIVIGGGCEKAAVSIHCRRVTFVVFKTLKILGCWEEPEFLHSYNWTCFIVWVEEKAMLLHLLATSLVIHFHCSTEATIFNSSSSIVITTTNKIMWLTS